MELYFIRHGESANNRLYADTGDWRGRSTDPELTELGHVQAQRLADHLARPGSVRAATEDYQNASGFGLTHLYTSLMVRAVQTSSPVAKALDLPLHGLTDLHEFRGIFQFEQQGERWLPVGLPGITPTELKERFPELNLPSDLHPEGWWQSRSEGRREMLLRAQRILTLLRDRHSTTQDRVALFSHGGFYHAFLYALLRLPLPTKEEESRFGFSFGINNTAITRVAFDEHGVNVLYMNNVAHLAPEEITS